MDQITVEVDGERITAPPSSPRHLPIATRSIDLLRIVSTDPVGSLDEVPSLLAEAHRTLRFGGRLEIEVSIVIGVTAGPERSGSTELDHMRLGRTSLERTVKAAAFRPIDLEIHSRSATATPDATAPDIEATAVADIRTTAEAERRLPDHVGPGMRLLCCGLNPSLHAADAGVGYTSPSNRFWPALLRAGLTDRDRDPAHLLRRHRIGMTDLVARATPRAAELHASEYREGLDRLRDLCVRHRPVSLAVVGLAGWRAAVDRRAVAGWQPEPLGPTPVYLLPSTSGLNAHVSVDGLAEHLLRAASGPDPDGFPPSP